MKTKNEYIDSLSAKLKEWSAEIDGLTTKADKLASDVKLKYLEEVADLRTQIHTAALQINVLEEASGEAWESLKVGSDKAWEKLKADIDASASKFD